MFRLYRLVRPLCLLTTLLANVRFGPLACGAESLVVETRSGRTFSGQIDERTSSHALAIRSGNSTMFIVRPIQWSAIERVRVDGKALAPGELLRRFETEGWPSGAWELPQPPAPAPPAARPPAPSDLDADEDAGPSADRRAAPVRSLQLEVSAAKWSGGAENDGLLVRILPLDAEGNVVPANGTLEVDLIGQQPATLTQGRPFDPMARWVQTVSSRDFGSNGAAYRLAYQAWHPEMNLHWGSAAAVHARLSVPGEGVFDDTATMVRIRPFSTTRDRLQQFTGERFFPQERTNRGVVDTPSAPDP